MAHQLTRLRHGTAERDVRSARVSQSMTATSHHLIQAKLKPPQLGDDLHRSPRPAVATRRRRQAKLTLLTAPIGSGKTTLLAQWHQRVAPEQAVAWLSLDELDNDPVRFFSYLIAAVRAVCPAFDAYIPHQRNVDESLDATAAVFIASLGRIERPVDHRAR